MPEADSPQIFDLVDEPSYPVSISDQPEGR
jgi:hypothetical protein